MGTITLRGGDARAFLEAWRDTNVADPRRVLCTRCQAGEGQRCWSQSTGNEMRGYHAERQKLERRARAVAVLQNFGPMTAGGFAGRFWRDCDPHYTARNAATFLFTLWQEGLVLINRDQWGTTYEARK